MQLTDALEGDDEVDLAGDVAAEVRASSTSDSEAVSLDLRYSSWAEA